VNFRSRINYASDATKGDKNASDALQAVYEAYKKFIGADMLMDALPFTPSTRTKKNGDIVKGLGQFENYGTASAATYVITNSKRQVDSHNMEAYNEHMLDLVLADGKIVPIRTLAHEDYLKHAEPQNP